MAIVHRNGGGDWAPRFFQALNESEAWSITDSARIAGVTRDAIYKRRERDHEFAERLEETRQLVKESLEREGIQRAKKGSDLLLMFFLNALDPATYRHRQRVEHTGPDGGPPRVELNMGPDARQALAALLRTRPAGPGLPPAIEASAVELEAGDDAE